jgi:hypothetical protein
VPAAVMRAPAVPGQNAKENALPATGIITAVALDYGGYAVTFRVSQLLLRVRWDAEAATGEPPPASGLSARLAGRGVPGSDRLLTGVRAA